MKTRELSIGLIRFSLSTSPADWGIAELVIIALIPSALFFIEFYRSPISVSGNIVSEKNIYDFRMAAKKCLVDINTTEGVVSDYYFGSCSGLMRVGGSVRLKVGIGLFTHHLVAVHDSVAPR